MYCPGRPIKSFGAPKGPGGLLTYTAANWNQGSHTANSSYTHVQYGRLDTNITFTADGPSGKRSWKATGRDILAYEPTGYRIEGQDGDYIGYDIYVNQPIDGLGPMKSRHGQGYNVMFFDGSVQWAQDPDNSMEINYRNPSWGAVLPLLRARLP